MKLTTAGANGHPQTWQGPQTASQPNGTGKFPSVLTLHLPKVKLLNIPKMFNYETKQILPLANSRVDKIFSDVFEFVTILYLYG